MSTFSNLLKLSLLPLLAASLNAASSYKVQAGDTLSSIARKNGTTPSKLMSANGISDPNMLRVGQSLKISGGSASKPAPKKTTSSTSSKPRTSGSGNYSVKPGETLYAIARSHGISVSQLTAMNPGLDPSKLSVGQKINTKSSSSTSVSSKPAPKKKVVKKEPVIAQQKPKATPKPAPKPKTKLVNAPSPALVIEAPKPTAPKVEAKPIKQPSTIASVTVNKEISFGALAARHRSSTKQLNALNGWRLKPTQILAKGSEIYVPGN